MLRPDTRKAAKAQGVHTSCVEIVLLPRNLRRVKTPAQWVARRAGGEFAGLSNDETIARAEPSYSTPCSEMLKFQAVFPRLRR